MLFQIRACYLEIIESIVWDGGALVSKDASRSIYKPTSSWPRSLITDFYPLSLTVLHQEVLAIRKTMDSWGHEACLSCTRRHLPTDELTAAQAGGSIRKRFFTLN